MEVVLIIVVIAIGLLILFSIFLPWLNLYNLKKIFNNQSVIVFGRKGSGKDLLFQAIINTYKNGYLSNQNYGGKYENINISEMNVAPNTYETLLNNNITIVKKNDDFEKKDIFISDGGIYLPAQYDYLLNKFYKSMPLYFALSRQLYNQNIHINTQNIERIRKQLREQADYFIKVRRSLRIFNTFYIFYTTYDKYSSAQQDLRQIGALKSNKYGKTTKAVYNASNGEIKNGYIKLKIKNIYYDTRAFHKKLFGYDFKKMKLLERLKMAFTLIKIVYLTPYLLKKKRS